MQNSNQHRQNDFTPVTGAMDLADYVITITDNVNTFPDFIRAERKESDGAVSQVFIQRQDSLTQIVRDQVFRLFLYIKEKLLAKIYLRYMDDGFIVSADREYLERCRVEIERQLAKLGMHLHPKKTVIYRLSDGIPILGFTFRLTATGKVVRIIDPKNVKHERKKLYRMAQLVKSGVMTREKFNECYTSWKAHAKLGNSYKLVQRMDGYVKSLFMEVNNGERTE